MRAGLGTQGGDLLVVDLDSGGGVVGLHGRYPP
jgi:hypothetical protein